MLRCREISELVSESMERDLSLRQKLQVWMHLAMCRLCLGFARQVRLLRRAAREYPDRFYPDSPGTQFRLSEDARSRIKAALQDSSN